MLHFSVQTGKLHPDLKMGADVATAVPLSCQSKHCQSRHELHGAGFIITRTRQQQLGLGRVDGHRAAYSALSTVGILTQTARDVMVIDFLGYAR